MHSYWDSFYLDFQHTNGSTFAELIRQKLTGRRIEYVIDLGCGNGRDSFEFARGGLKVIAVDSSLMAVRQIEARGDNNVTAICSNVTEPELWRQIDARRGAEARFLFYARFFLHAIEPGMRQKTIESISKIARASDLLAFEYRTLADSTLEHFHGSHERHFVDHDALIARLDELGWTVLEAAQARGLSLYQNEDPMLGRIWAEF